MANDHFHGRTQIARLDISLLADLFGLPAPCSGQQTLSAAKTTDDALHRDTGTARHLLERDVRRRLLEEDPSRGIENPLAPKRRRLRGPTSLSTSSETSKATKRGWDE